MVKKLKKREWTSPLPKPYKPTHAHCDNSETRNEMKKEEIKYVSHKLLYLLMFYSL